MADLRRGPKIGDSASLWNFTPSPGWTKEEAQILKLCLAKHGIGRWVQILDSGLLPGKLIQQLNGQTQRLLGQQSLAAYTGLKVDIDRIRADNNAKTDVDRKSGLIIRTGKNPTKKMRDEWQREAIEKYGLSEEQLAEVDEKLEEIKRKMTSVGGSGQTRQELSAPVISLMDSNPADLNRSQKLHLLKRLHQQLTFLYSKLEPQNERPTAAASTAEVSAKPHATEADVLQSVDGNVDHSPKEGAKAEAPKQEKGCAVAPSAAAEEGLPLPRSQPAPKAKKRPASGKRATAPVAKPKKRKTVEEMEEEEEGEGEKDGKLKQLVAMGFERRKCQDALEEACGDLQAAVEYLFSTCV